MPLVAVHQPNYLPWLGYFRKIAMADVFVFLDDVQYSKNSYINRVQIMADGKARWLTVPVSAHLGDPINRVRPARRDWRQAHLDALRTRYGSVAAFPKVWPVVRDSISDSPDADIAAINRHLVVRIAEALGIGRKFVCSSQMAVGPAKGDDRLVGLVAGIAPDACYLSGQGGAKYQDPEKFRRAGLGFRYLDFDHPRYDQGMETFVPGLSVLDAVFRLGWDRTADLLTVAAPAA